MKKKREKGLLITFEGIEGVGKSSAVRALFNNLMQDYEVVLTKEPGATQVGKHLREILQQRTVPVSSKTEFLLFAADRAQHFTELVIPSLEKGICVISDRMADSSYAYQGFGRGIDPSAITFVNQWAMMGIQPDITFYLTLDYATAMKRLEKRNEAKTHFEQLDQEFFNRVVKGFEEILATRKGVYTIDASLSEENVHQKIITIARSLLS